MTEVFAADPAEICGMGNLSVASASDLRGADSLTSDGAPASGYSGLMTLLEPVVQKFSDDMAYRVHRRADVTDAMGAELKRCAWMYTAQDHENAASLAHLHSLPVYTVRADGGALPAIYDDVPGAQVYPASQEPDLAPPEHRDADVKALVDSTTGILHDVDKAIQTVTSWVSRGDGWSPVSAAVEPIAGNWAELERSGEAFAKAGAACETIAGNLLQGAGRLDRSWDGKAAIAYQDYVAHLTKALQWEGAVGRLAQRVLQKTSAQIQETAKTMLDKLSEIIQDRIIGAGLKDVFIKVSTTLLPGKWIFEAIEIGHAILDVWHEVQELLHAVNALINDAKAVIAAIENPADAIQGTLEEKLKPLQDKVSDAEDSIQFGEDLATAADWSAVDGAPAAGFAVSGGGAAWADAQ